MHILKRKIQLLPSIEPVTSQPINTKIEVKLEELSDIKSNCLPYNPLTIFIDIKAQMDNFQIKKEEEEPTQPSSPNTIYHPLKVNIGSKSKKKSLKVEEDTRSRNLVTQPTKIVRNYAKIFCSFASSGMATPYLKNLIATKYRDKIELEKFQKFIYNKKEHTFSILTLRTLLLIHPNDEELIKEYKKLFADISIIFLKFYAVNWIFNSKIKHRIEHLKCRQKMIRRVRNPELFTYLKG